MIKKLKENFLILLISNLVTVALVVIAPTIFGVITNQSYIFRDEHLIFSLPMMFYCFMCIVCVCTVFSIFKSQNIRDIVINNSITSAINSNETDKATIMRERYIAKQQSRKSAILDAVSEYTYAVFSPYMTDDNLEILNQNIKLYEVPDSCVIPVCTNGQLNTLDIRHYAWNIGERLGWSGQQQWLKACGITKHITFHCFRHTYASLQLEMGTDIYTVQHLLNHKNVSTTQIYASHADPKTREAANRITLTNVKSDMKASESEICDTNTN
jgi:hypothetical protein